jgi:hypothetical protein
MTIALGFPCVDGVVLCTDSQMTSRGAGMKYNESKISTIVSMGGPTNYRITLAYSGDASMMKTLYEKLMKLIDPRKKQDLTETGVVEALQEALNYTHSLSPNIDTEFVDVICGISINGDISMYVAHRTILHQERELAVLGVGDSSLFRYLAKTLPVASEPMYIKTAQLLGAYIVQQAKDFIDGCGGDTHLAAIRRTGLPEMWDNEKTQHLDELTVLVKNIQWRVEETILAVTDSDFTEMSKLENELRRTKKQVDVFYGLNSGDSSPTL